ncbi:MAG: PilZ domain-containing protein [Myxococcota bacterium]
MDEPHFRRGGRRPVALRVRFRAGEALEHDGTTVDISLGGAFIETRSLPDVGQDIVLHLDSPTAWDTLEIACRVRWVSDGSDGRGHGFGVKFEGLSGSQSTALYELLQATEFSGGST